MGKGGYKEDIRPKDIFYYLYAVMFSPLYRATYLKHINNDFPSLPFTWDEELFLKLSRLGKELAGIHLGKTLVESPVITIPGKEKDIFRVEEIRFEEEKKIYKKRKVKPLKADKINAKNWTCEPVDFPYKKFHRWGRVYIDDNRYFSNIPRELWEYRLSGYQVLSSFLNGRKKKGLTMEAVGHFQDMVGRLGQTVEYQSTIDELFPQVEDKLLRVHFSCRENFSQFLQNFDSID